MTAQSREASNSAPQLLDIRSMIVSSLIDARDEPAWEVLYSHSRHPDETKRLYPVFGEDRQEVRRKVTEASGYEEVPGDDGSVVIRSKMRIEDIRKY